MLLKTLILQCLIWGLVKSTTSDSYRLPTDILPKEYSLDIITIFDDAFKFKGHVDIEVECVKPTNRIYLHAKNLTIEDDKISLRDLTDDKKLIPIEKVSYDKDKDFMIIHINAPLKENHKYLIGIKFEGKLSDNLVGYYRSYYETKDGQKKWLAVTQFQAVYARTAFPCFDEPSMKAIFKITLGRENGYTSISNMPLVETKPMDDNPGWFWDSFEKSVPMPTYLVAYMVSDFGQVQSSLRNLGNNVTFKIWTRKDAIEQVDLANEVGPKALAFFEKFYDLDFPLPKQDMVAVPDFSAGAMENWGLITYRETALLYDKTKSTIQNRFRVASVIAHELAHQWFGNLVTMRWWTDLWLNEGFATYMSTLALHNLYPEWHSMEQDVVQGAVSVFHIDALKTSHPVSVKIDDPSLISEIFDTISYEKGSFLIRMMSLFLGEQSLREGVNNYLKKHKFDNADQDDLWESLTEAAHRNKVLSPDMTVKKIMDSWTLQTGYPVVTVERNYDDGTALLTQSRFLRDTILRKNSTEGNCWSIPLTYTTLGEMNVNNTVPELWMKCPQEEEGTKISGLKKDEWLLMNLQLASLYKVNYDEKNWKLLSETLHCGSFEDIPVLNRVQLIEDSSEFAWVGLMEYNMFFDIVSYLERESEYTPWMTALDNMNLIDTQTRQYPTYNYFKEYMKRLLRTPFDKFGMKVDMESERLDTVSHQVMIIGKSCQYGITKCLTEAKEMFSKYQEDPDNSPIPKELRGVVYCTGIKEGDEKEWNFLWNRYKSSNFATEKNSMLRSLGCSKNNEILKRYLHYSIQENSDVRRQDSLTVFSSVLGNIHGYQIARDFFLEEFDKIHGFYKGELKVLGRYIKLLAKYTTKTEDHERLTDFLMKNKDKLSDSKQAIKQSMETVELNLQWQKKYQENMRNILEEITEKY